MDRQVPISEKGNSYKLIYENINQFTVRVSFSTYLYNQFLGHTNVSDYEPAFYLKQKKFN